MDAFFTSVPLRIASERSPAPRPNSFKNNINENSKNADRSAFDENQSRSSSSKWNDEPITYSNSNLMVKPPAIERNLECTLEVVLRMYEESEDHKRCPYTIRKIIQEDEILSIKVHPGWKKGTKVTFEGMGNESLGTYAADVTFVIAEKHHSLFRRDGDDLELNVEIPLVKALSGCSVPIPLLGGETMDLEIDEIISPGYQRVIEGQGMANKKQEGSRGNLKLSFVVIFPKELTSEQQAAAVSILGDSG
ncbi:Eukaryotic aspartyl protease family protein isoform 1 [Hibiscus syriacus]|uniref:Eukaryotic aspartyl protease family protein isoform 1 n=2 Tax=Hibiscus syriacus TaxID=106335 RepID=A0A6A2WQ56_HIBSY|nr:Eukaryotic aspartyl protease family protein isoform 1 [Hibiscus syriacus]